MNPFRKFTLLVIFISHTFLLNAQANDGDKIIGAWFTGDKKALIEIFKADKYYYGKLTWSLTMYEADGKTSKKDIHNEDKTLQSRPIKNLLLLTGFTYNDGVWENGKIYDPKNGKTYLCTLRMKEGALHVRGYIGISLFGRTDVWTKK